MKTSAKKTPTGYTLGYKDGLYTAIRYIEDTAEGRTAKMIAADLRKLFRQRREA